MNSRTTRWGVFALLLCAASGPAWAIDNSIPAIHGDLSRSLLGDGTGTIIGIIDSGVDDTHPALNGLDSLGNPRMVAEANFVTSEPGNFGDDVFGHGTWVASAALSSDSVYKGMATDARFVNARVLDAGGGFPNDVPVRNGVGFAIGQGADVINLSLNYFAAVNGGNTQLELMLDWASFNQGISCAVCAGNISTSSGGNVQTVRGPGSLYNGITVGRLTADFTKVSTDSAGAFTGDGRMKPEVVAPGSLLTLANDDWEGAEPDFESIAFGSVTLNGCSFATPIVAGLMAQQIDAGKRLGMSTDPLVVKATIMNSANKAVLDKQSNPWTPGQPGSTSMAGGVFSASEPLDTHSGAGTIDGLGLAAQYLAGEMGPGLVDEIGWDLNSIGNGQFVDYLIDPSLIVGGTLNATLTWYRHVGRTDNGNGLVDSGDSFFALKSLSNLDLQILKNGTLIAESVSEVDNVEHLSWHVDETAQYTLRVSGVGVTGGSEQFGLAWYGTAVPEPASWLLGICAAGGMAVRRRRRAS